MLKEGSDTMLAGDVETGKAILRDYINAAVGFEPLAEATNVPAKSLMRMLAPRETHRRLTCFRSLSTCKPTEGIHLEVAPCRGALSNYEAQQ